MKGYKLPLFLLSFLPLSSLFADKYYIRHENGKDIVIINERHQIISRNFEEFLQNIKKGDELLFKRGEVFKKPIILKNKENLSIKDYGSKKLRYPIIDTRYRIDEDSFIKLDMNNLKKDRSWRVLESEFKKNLAPLSSKVRQNIAKNFDEVKDSVFEIYRVKISPIDWTSVRVWVNNKEILKALIFEELKEKDDARWYFEKQNGYLYIFVLNKDFKLKNVKINNMVLDSLSLKNCKNIDVENLDIRASKYAVGIRGSLNVVLQSCKIGRYSFSALNITSGDMGDYSSNIVIKDNEIDSGFKAFYRFLSSRGSQDGIFMLKGVKDSLVLNNKIINWGHSAINIYAPKNALPVKNNKIISNFISGKNISYMHGVTIDGMNAVKNEVRLNIIRDISARNQLNGRENRFVNNAVFDVRNSPVKSDQGYSAAQAIELQAYGKDNISKGNIIKDNLFAKVDGSCISLVSFSKDGEKRDNIFENNVLINCGLKNGGVFLKVDDGYGRHNIEANSFINNRFKATKREPKIFYRGETLSVEEFNFKDGSFEDRIEGNEVMDRED
ncbi:MAG: right-handed parallel beta-helix repeat-containing protein [Epsilonproteobacteria bacterium]|nr:right-handed parallel beta-helix repeat-containing protein [Campylobacterota bacterium]